VPPEIRYAKSGDVHIAYQSFGQGADNIVIIPGFISHIEHVWDSPDQTRWLNHWREERASLCSTNEVLDFPIDSDSYPTSTSGWMTSVP
jgi:hypothetical protein